MTKDTIGLAESCYLLGRALRSRGFRVNEVDSHSFKIENETTHFTLTFMPGNKRVLISSNVKVYPEFQGKKYGTKYLLMREEIAREAKCNLILATVREDNSIEIHLLEKHGWKRFNKRETGVCLWGKEL